MKKPVSVKVKEEAARRKEEGGSEDLRSSTPRRG
jgi:hypothetical protein